MLENRGAVLETAVKVSRILEGAKIDGAIIGGISVFLHGHARTTRDVDVFVRGPLGQCKAPFEAAGLVWDTKEREFYCDGVPVQLVNEDVVQPEPKKFTRIDDVTTLRLSDLISIKLRCGMENVTRAQDIADVIGLIRVHQLGGGFARYLDKGVRSEFKKLVRAVRGE